MQFVDNMSEQICTITQAYGSLAIGVGPPDTLELYLLFLQACWHETDAN